MEVERFQAEVLSKIHEDFNQERAVYEKKIKSCADETAILRADVNLKSETIDSLTTDVAELNARLGLSRSTNQRLKKRLNEMEENYSNLCANHYVTSKRQQDTIAEQNSRLASMEEEIKMLLAGPANSKIVSVQKYCSDSKKDDEISSLKMQLSLVQEDLAASNARASSLDIKLNESANREKELNSELSELKSELDYVKIAANLLGEHLVSEKERVNKEEQLNKDLLAAKEKVIEENNKLKEQLDNYAALLEEIQLTHEKTKAKNWDLLHVNAGFQKKFDSLEQRLKDSLKDNDAVAEESAKLLLANESLEKEIEVLLAELGNMEQLLKERNATIEEHRLFLNQAENISKKELLEKIKKITAEKEELLTSSKTLTEVNCRLQEQLNASNLLLSEGNELLENERSSNKEYRTLIERLSQENDILEDQRNNLEQLLNENQIAMATTEQRARKDRSVSLIRINELEKQIKMQQAAIEESKVQVKELFQGRAREHLEALKTSQISPSMVRRLGDLNANGLNTHLVAKDEMKTLESTLNLWEKVALSLIESNNEGVAAQLSKLQQLLFELYGRILNERSSNMELHDSIKNMEIEKREVLRQLTTLELLHENAKKRDTHHRYIALNRICKLESQLASFQRKADDAHEAEKRQLLQRISFLNEASIKSKEEVKQFQQEAIDQIIFLKSAFTKLTTMQNSDTEKEKELNPEQTRADADDNVVEKVLDIWNSEKDDYTSITEEVEDGWNEFEVTLCGEGTFPSGRPFRNYIEH